MNLPPLNVSRTFGVTENLNKPAKEMRYLSSLLHKNDEEFQNIFRKQPKKLGRILSLKYIQDPQLSKIKDLRNASEPPHFPILVKKVKLAPCHSPDFFLHKNKSKTRFVSNLNFK